MKNFKTKEEAIAWVVEHVDDPCVDNERFAFVSDLDAMDQYEDQKAGGCCGDFDAMVMVNGRSEE